MSSVLLPEPEGPDDGDALADVQPQAEVVQHRRRRAFVLERDAVERDVVDDARQCRRARPIRAARRLVEQFLDVTHRGRGLDRHRNEMHHVRDVVGHFPERAFEGDEGADRDLAGGREIRADREHHEVQQQHRYRHAALHHRGEECRGAVLRSASRLRRLNQPKVRRCRLNAFTTACAATFSWIVPSNPASICFCS